MKKLTFDEFHYFDLKAGLVKVLLHDLYQKDYQVNIDKDEFVEKLQSMCDNYLKFKCQVQWNHKLNFSIIIESEPENSVVDFEVHLPD